MHYQYILPCSKLQPYVEYYLAIESTNDEPNKPVIVYPTPQAEMVFNYGGKTVEQIGSDASTESNNWAVSGFFTKKTTYNTQGQLGAIMIGFKPWGIQPFLNFHAEEINNTNLDLKLVYASEARITEEKLSACNNTTARIKIIEEFLFSILKQKSSDQLIINSVQSIFHQNGNGTVTKLSKEYCLSEKQFVRRFKAAIGINPKLFSRLVRFQYILKLLDNGNMNLLGPAIESGFYDSSHFIHEFTTFTGTPPSAYLNESARTNLGIYVDKQIEQSPYYHLIYQ